MWSGMLLVGNVVRDVNSDEVVQVHQETIRRLQNSKKCNFAKIEFGNAGILFFFPRGTEVTNVPRNTVSESQVVADVRVVDRQ